MQDLKHSLIAPNENFVVIQDAASSEGTKALTDEDRKEIRQQTSSNMYGNESFEAAYAGFNQGRYGGGGPEYAPGGYNDPYYQNQPGGPGYQNGYNDPGYDRYQGQYGGPGYDNRPMEDMEDPYYVMDPRNKRRPNPERGQVPDQAEALRAKQAGKGAKGNRMPAPQPGKPPKKKGSKPNTSGKYADKVEEDDTDVDPKMEKIMTVLMIVAAILLGLGAVWIVSRAMGTFTKDDDTAIEEGMTEVPNVVGMSLAEASDALKAAGLTAKASYAESQHYDKDYIDSQDPAAGTIVEENSVLTLVVSSGRAPGAEVDIEAEPTAQVGGAAVPDVVGKSEAEARVAIENEGFVFASIEQENENVEKGKVISQSPLGATNAPLGSSIQVYISSGKTVEEVKVPDLSGKDEATARALLVEAGLTCNTSEENSDTVPKGNVISQSVAAGTTVEKGSSVDIKVSKGTSGYTCNATIQMPEGYLEGTDAIIVLIDAAGAEIGRFTTNSFPYTAVKTGITSSPAGVITVTYQTVDGQWQTSAPSAVTFTKE
jgi:serine/threonine-protein kinase